MSKAPPDHPNGSLYCDFMEFIKWRMGSVWKTIALLKSGKHYLDNRLAAEYCLLQLRMCCELLAIGCAAIHTDVSVAKLQKEWSAHRIMKLFEDLKPEFFPHPIKDDQRDSDGAIIMEDNLDGALTRQELLDMYNLFGDLLHTGNLERYKSKEKRTYDFSMLETFCDKLVALLNTHVYYLYDKNMMVRVIMHNARDGRVWLNALNVTKRPE